MHLASSEVALMQIELLSLTPHLMIDSPRFEHNNRLSFGSEAELDLKEGGHRSDD
jgi:hypothetical protein